MKNLTTIVVALLLSAYSYSQSKPFISEINYSETDSGIEITGTSGTNLEGWSLIFYKGTSKKMYDSFELYGTITGEGKAWYTISGINNGHPKGAAIALLDINDEVIEFLSYGGAFVPKDGPLKGIESTDIGIDISTLEENESLQKTNSGWNIKSNNSSTNRTLSVDNSALTNFKVYPSLVTQGEFRVTTASIDTKKVDIYNIQGKQVYSKSVEINEVVNVSNLNAGIYIVNVEQDSKMGTKKIIIK